LVKTQGLALGAEHRFELRPDLVNALLIRLGRRVADDAGDLGLVLVLGNFLDFHGAAPVADWAV
jgi:hypothetical protein